MRKSKKLLEKELERIIGFDCIYIDNRADTEFEDDGFIHIVRQGFRFVFYNGQGKGSFKEKDISRFIKIINKTLNKKEKS